MDWLTLTVREPVEDVESEVLALIVAEWADVHAPVAWDERELVRTDRAGNFSERRTWAFRGLRVLEVLKAGASTRGVSHVEMSGEPCALVNPWFFGRLADLAARRGWRLRRCDLAVDDDSGEIDPELVEAAYWARKLSKAGAGALPMFDPRHPRRGGEACGWTTYVGKRGGARYLRVYQKHAQLVAKFGQAVADMVPQHRVRLEAELRAVEGELPLDVLREPAEFFAGVCPFFAARAGGVVPRVLSGSVRHQRENVLAVAMGHCRNSYGAHVEQLFQALGGDEQAATVVIDMIRRRGAKPPVEGVQPACYVEPM